MTITDLLRDRGISFLEGNHRHARPGWVQIDCPWCGQQSQKYHLGYNLALKYWNCWRCGGKHPVQVLIKLGLAREEAEEAFRSADPEFVFKRERSRLSLKEPKGRGPLLPQHRAYLRERGYDADEMEKIWQLEGIGLHPRLQWRIYIPITQKGVRVSWTSRSISLSAKQRYISASADEEVVNHKDVVFGLDYVKASVVICEGPFDAMKIGPGATALFGTTFSTAQVNQLIQIPYRYVCFDNSPTAQMKARDLARQLSIFEGETSTLELEVKDPGELSKSEIRKLRRACHLE